MKILLAILAVALIGAGGLAVTARKEVDSLRRENEALRAELKTLKDATSAERVDKMRQHDVDVQKHQTDAQEINRLRAEVTQLRLGGKEAEKLRVENQKLKSDGEKMRSAAASATAATAEVKVETPQNAFPRSSWKFSGYATPEAAIVSAMSAMNEGNPKVYYDSLTPAEQERILKSWEGKSEQEIAAKHLADAARIDSLNIIGQQVVSPSEIWLTVSAPGPDGTARTMLVPMMLIGDTWKFDGFKRPAGGVPGAAKGR